MESLSSCYVASCYYLNIEYLLLFVFFLYHFLICSILQSVIQIMSLLYVIHQLAVILPDPAVLQCVVVQDFLAAIFSNASYMVILANIISQLTKSNLCYTLKAMIKICNSLTPTAIYAVRTYLKQPSGDSLFPLKAFWALEKDHLQLHMI